MATTITSPKLWKPGDPLNAVNLNAELRDQMNGLLGGPYCNVNIIAAPPNIAASTHTLVAWTNEVEDTDNMHDLVTNPSRITIPISGVYYVLMSWRFVWNTAGFRYLRLYINGVAAGGEVTESPGAGGGTTLQMERTVRLKATDYLEMDVWQSSAGALAGEINTPNTLSMQVMWERA